MVATLYSTQVATNNKSHFGIHYDTLPNAMGFSVRSGMLRCFTDALLRPSVSKVYKAK